jgi:heptosyltransferase-2
MARVLLIAPQWIGDAVMAQPLVALLAARGELVTALGLPGVAPVLRAMPGVVEVIEAPFAHGKLDFAARRRIAAQLRTQGFACTYILGNNVKSRLVPWLARIPQRIGYRGEARGLLLTDARQTSPSAAATKAARPAEPFAISPIACRMPKDATGHAADNTPAGAAPAEDLRGDMRLHYLALATVATAGEQPGGAVAALAAAPRQPSAPTPEPTLHITAGAASAARLQYGLPERWIALCPGAEYGPAKQWPVEHYAALARLAQQQDYTVAMLGAPRDAQTGEAIAAQAPGSINLCGATQLSEAIALLAGCSGAVCNDSGLMHVAAALGRPTVGVYGSTDPRHTPPAAHRSAAIWLQLDCSPCFERICPLGHLNCLRGITPEQTWAQLRGLMQGS